MTGEDGEMDVVYADIAAAECYSEFLSVSIVSEASSLETRPLMAEGRGIRWRCFPFCWEFRDSGLTSTSLMRIGSRVIFNGHILDISHPGSKLFPGVKSMSTGFSLNAY